MKNAIVKICFAACLALTAFGAMAQSTLGYGTIRQRAMIDSTGAPTLVGIPPAPKTPPPPSGLGSSPPGSHCGWFVIHNDGNFSPSLPCNGQMIPMGNIYQCAAGQLQSGFPGSPCFSSEWVETCGDSCTWGAAITFYPAIGSTIGAVYNERAVTFWNCPAGWPLTFLNAPDGKREYTCIKS